MLVGRLGYVAGALGVDAFPQDMYGFQMQASKFVGNP